MWTYLKKLIRSNPLENPNIPLGEAIDLIGSEPSVAGVRINHDAVLSIPAVSKAIRLISGKVADMPLNIYKKTDYGREKATYLPQYWLLNREPNQLLTPSVLKKTVIKNCIVYGNAFCAILRSQFAEPEELWLLDPSATSLHTENGNVYYRTEVNEKSYVFSPSDILHFKAEVTTNDGQLGLGLLDLMRDSLGLSIAMTRHASRFWANNAKPSYFVIMPPGNHNPEAREKFREDVMKVHAGVMNSNKPGIFNGGTTITELNGANNRDSQFIEAREFDLITASNLVNIPPSYCGSAINTSYQSLQADQLSFLQDSISPWLRMIEEECFKKLLSEAMKYRDQHYFEFDTRSIVSIDAKTEAELLVMYRNNGLLNWEEAREKINMPTDKKESDNWLLSSGIRLEKEALQELELKKQAAEQPPVQSQQLEQPQDNNQLRSLTKITLNRLKTRLERAAEKDSFDIESHRQIFDESLEPFKNREKVINDLFDELTHVLPEQRAKVIHDLDVDQIVKILC